MWKKLMNGLYSYFNIVYSSIQTTTQYCFEGWGNETVNLISTPSDGVENMVKGYI